MGRSSVRITKVCVETYRDNAYVYYLGHGDGFIDVHTCYFNLNTLNVCGYFLVNYTTIKLFLKNVHYI